ncbi:transcriptional regulator swi6 [Linnemannia schmuckeri]|uniref:Transcriptional regulator swi6 n=1 Tax=Linnemannia schmuckeri TaxID=64567 RepID=A0A9P5S6F5_9FUNG|nr:transcriptional regulator swi6 [Linnemannia schmuckeri]
MGGDSGNSNIYTAIYSGVPVYELMCRGIAVMRRTHDSFLNATQILKVAGIDKGKRTKILEREVLTGPHEKVQGGYGKYQGTWVPFQRGKDLAKQYKVEPLLRDLFDFQIPEGHDAITPSKEMFQAALKAKERPKPIAAVAPKASPSAKRSRNSPALTPGSAGSFNHAPSMTPSPLHPSFNVPSPMIPSSPQWPADQPPRKRFRTNNSPPPLHEFDDDGRSHNYYNHGPPPPPSHHHHHRQHSSQHHSPHHSYHGGYGHQQPYHPPHRGDPYSEYGVDYDSGRRSGHIMAPVYDEPPLEGAEKYRTILMSIFLNDDQDPIPDLLTDPVSPPDLDINLVIDDQGHSAMHWAAALARIPVLELLVRKQVDIRRVNYNGESALIRAVLVTNNFDKQSFPILLSLLHQAIPLVDRKNRTLLHHIAITAGIRGREQSSRYYMECLLEWIARHGGDFESIVDVQDRNGDTALTIAARVGDRYLAKVLMDVGANRDIENKVGLKADDFGVDDIQSTRQQQPRPSSNSSAAPTAPDPGVKEDLDKMAKHEKRGGDILNVVQKMLDELDGEFSHEIMARQGQLQDALGLLRQATAELSETRRSIKQYRTQSLQLTEAQHKIKNLEQALEEEVKKARSLPGYAGLERHEDGSVVNDVDVDAHFAVPSSAAKKDTEKGDGLNNGTSVAEEASATTATSSTTTKEGELQEEILRLKARIHAYEQHSKELSNELVEIKDKSLDKELQCRKVISICCSIPLEKVDEMLVPLTLAVESDGASLDLSRVAGFMSKVKQQDGIASIAAAAVGGSGSSNANGDGGSRDANGAGDSSDAAAPVAATSRAASPAVSLASTASSALPVAL